MEGSVNVTKFVILSTLFGVLTEERLLVEGGRPCPGCWVYNWGWLGGRLGLGIGGRIELLSGKS